MATEKEMLPCCENYIGPDFSKIEFQKLDLCVLSNVDFCDWNLWLSLAAIVLHPAFYSMLHKLDSSPFKEVVIHRLTFVETLTFIFSLCKLWKFYELLFSQPIWEALQVSYVLWVGYGLLFLGIFFFALCLCRFGFWDTFCRWDFRKTLQDSPIKENDKQPPLPPSNVKGWPLLLLHGIFYNMCQSGWCAPDRSSGYRLPLLVPWVLIRAKSVLYDSGVADFSASLTQSQKTVVIVVVGLTAFVITVLVVVMILCCLLEKKKQDKAFQKRENRVGHNARRGQVGPDGEGDEEDGDEDDENGQNQRAWYRQGQYHRFPDHSMWRADNAGGADGCQMGAGDGPDLWNPANREMWRAENSHMWSSPPSYRSTETPTQAPSTKKSKRKKRQTVAPTENGQEAAHASPENVYSQHLQQQQQQLAYMLQNGQISQEEYQQHMANIMQAYRQSPEQRLQQYRQQLETMLETNQITREQYEQQTAALMQRYQQVCLQGNQQVLQQHQLKLRTMLEKGQITQQQYEQHLERLQHSARMDSQQVQQYQQQLASMLQNGQISQQQYEQKMAVLQQHAQQAPSQPVSQQQQHQQSPGNEEEGEKADTAKPLKGRQQEVGGQEQDVGDGTQEEVNRLEGMKQQEQIMLDQTRMELQRKLEEASERETRCKEEQILQKRLEQEQLEQERLEQECFEQEPQRHGGEEQDESAQEEFLQQQQLFMGQELLQKQGQVNQEEQEHQGNEAKEDQEMPESSTSGKKKKRRKVKKPASVNETAELDLSSMQNVQYPEGSFADPQAMYDPNSGLMDPSMLDPNMGFEMVGQAGGELEAPGMENVQMGAAASGEGVMTDQADPSAQVMAMNNVSMMTPATPAFYVQPEFYAGDMYMDQPPSYPGMEGMMMGAGPMPMADPSAGGMTAPVEGDRKKKKKKKTPKKKEKEEAAYSQAGDDVDVTEM